ncbi:MAG TPA: hypothetical protein VLZ89_06660 [Anaerolineales bacterium]|nr:hypothetical protein [Anaerolineales bacterium]
MQLRSFALILLLLAAACSGTTPTPPIPDSNLSAFTDQNRYYQIQLPKDWKHDQSSGSHYYVDTFTSPDGNAVIQNIAYDDGTPIVASTNAQFALDLLDKYFGASDRTDSITISDTSMMNDGSERLSWSSAPTDSAGISFIEIRGQTTFLIFTVAWKNRYKSQYFNILDQVVASYTVP